MLRICNPTTCIPKPFVASIANLTSLRTRYYATAVNGTNRPGRSDSSESSASSSNPSNWRSKPPLATAQTLTLFSDDATSLLIALKSTMTGMLTSANRAGKSPEVVGTRKEKSSEPRSRGGRFDYILLFTISKDLPKEHLAQAVSLLRGEAEGENSSDSSSSSIARIGTLSSSIPTSLIPASSLSSPLDPLKPLHSVSVSLLPATNSIPFRSVIGGKPKVQIGRWPDKKDSWKRKDERLEWLGNQSKDLAGSEAGEVVVEGEKSWRDLWGKENFKMDLPEELENVNDPSPQGLLEALDARFNRSAILGLTSPPTPFQTGRSRTMFSNLVKDEIHEDGAVGLVLIDEKSSSQSSTEGSFFMPNVKVDYEGFTTLGPRREITSARGNIISTLNSSNATQEFLRDIAARKIPVGQPQGEPSATKMSKETIRSISKDVKKEEDFYLGVFKAKESDKPLLLSRIMSGHPTRGSLSIETESELGPEIATTEIRSTNLWAQFYEKVPNKDFSPLDIPGPDPTVWSIPRFLFLSTSSDPLASADLDSMRTVEVGADGQKKKKQVMALPNLFVAGSEEGWIARNGNAKGGERAQGLENKSQTCKVPLASALLSLRGQSH